MSCGSTSSSAHRSICKLHAHPRPLDERPPVRTTLICVRSFAAEFKVEIEALAAGWASPVQRRRPAPNFVGSIRKQSTPRCKCISAFRLAPEHGLASKSERCCHPFDGVSGGRAVRFRMILRRDLQYVDIAAPVQSPPGRNRSRDSNFLEKHAPFLLFV